MTREHFDAQTGPLGALIIGGPNEVSEKIRRHSEALVGISRVTFQMDNAGLNHEKLMKAIELIGKEVVGMVRGE